MKRYILALLALALATPVSAQSTINARQVTVDGAGRLDTVVADKVATSDVRLPVKDDTRKTVTIVSTMPITSETTNTLAIGYNALAANVDSSETTAIGTDAAAGTQNGRTGTFVGYRAYYRGNGNSNTCLGAFTCGSAAGTLDAYPAFLGSNNTVAGEASGLFMSGDGPNFNSLYGFNSGFSLRGGDSNSFYGVGSGRSLAEGTQNNAFGVSSMKWAVGGSRNAFFGNSAGQGKQDIHNLTAALAQGGTTLYFTGDNPTLWAQVGDVIAAGGCLYDPAVSSITAVYSDRIVIDTPANTPNCGVGYPITNTHKAGTGTYNVGVGPSALADYTGSMSYNVAVGGLAGSSLSATDDTNARYNTMIGHMSGSLLTTGIRNITVGYNAQVPDATGTGQCSIGNLIYCKDRTLIAGSGLLGIGTDTPLTKLDVNGSMSIRSPSATGAGDSTLCWNGTTKEVRYGASCGSGGGGSYWTPSIETTKTNYLTQVNNFNASPWTLTNATATSATPKTPYAGVDAQTITSSTTGGYAQQILAVPSSSGTVYTASIAFNTGSAAANYSIQIAQCAASSTCASPVQSTTQFVVSSGVQSCGGAGYVCGTSLTGTWRRIWISLTNDTSTYLRIRVHANGGSGAASSAIVYGAQIEAHSTGADINTVTPSSYIPSGAVAAIRPAGFSPFFTPIVTATAPGLAPATGTPSGKFLKDDATFATIDKTTVGLSNVDNTADTAKPLSTASTTALALKVDASGGTATSFTHSTGSIGSAVTATTQTAGDSTTKVATDAFVTTAVAPKLTGASTAFASLGSASAAGAGAIRFVSDVGLSGSFWASDGTTWLPTAPITLCRSAVASSVTGTTSETAAASCTVPANVMGLNGQLSVRAQWTITGSTNSKTLRVRFGGLSGTAYVSGVTTTAGNVGYLATATIANRGATNSQIGAAAGAGAPGFANAAATTSSVDTTASVSIPFTATLANSGETATLESYEVRLQP